MPVKFAAAFAVTCFTAAVGCSKAAPTSPPSFEVGLGSVTCEQIQGWAWDKNRPDEPIEVEVYIDDVSIATVRADRFREDLQKAGKGNGNHSFAMPFPDSRKDGKEHSVAVGISGTNIRQGKAKQIRCSK